MKKRCGLYFGSFRPMHIGHLAIVNYLCAFTDLNEVRLVFSPLNPWKWAAERGETAAREDMDHVREVMRDRGLPVEVSDVEFTLPRPLYTIQTLETLSAREPDKEFVLCIGSDNMEIFSRWYRWEDILARYEIMVYPRQGQTCVCINPYKKYPHKGIIWLDAPLITISSTFIREAVAEGKNMNGFLV